MTDELRDVWAKSPRPPETQGESLAAHASAVLARLASWRRRNPDLARAVGRNDLWDVAAWASLLHDTGKIAQGFQAAVRGGPPFEHRHEVLSLVFVGRASLPEDVLGLVAATVATHHRDVGEIFERYPCDLPARQELLAHLVSEDDRRLTNWLADEGQRKLSQAGFRELPALDGGLAPGSALGRSMRAVESVRQRIEEGAAGDRLVDAVRAFRGLILLADHAASAGEALREAPSLAGVDALVRAAGPTLQRGLYRHQEIAAATTGHAALSAPTGSGKTEAALLWAARQVETTTGKPVLFYVLPFRASLNAMRDRMPAKYGLPDEAVVLQHSGATAALYERLLHKGYDARQAARIARHERSLGRLMTAPVRVLTPYQLLRGFFGLPGHEAILTDAAGGLFVLDELHAYEVERTGLILAAVEYLASRTGARFFAMSATFPRVLREAFAGALGRAPRSIEADEPTRRAFRRHVLRIGTEDLLSDAGLAKIARRAEAGEAVLVVATTVQRAQQAFDALRARLGGVPALLVHSRFTAEDRARKEREVATRLGTGTRHLGGTGIVVVATQVVEVSLDVDFDVLFTDPGPLESLVQRFGRVNRGRRGGLRDVVVQCPAPASGFGVYDDAAVARAMQILTPAADRPLEEQELQEWVDASYAPVADAWAAQLRSAIDQARAGVIEANRPLRSNPELRDAFDRLFDGREVVPESLAGQYRALQRDDPLRAAALRVPISERQYQRLRRRDLLVDREVVRLPYDEIYGLRLS